MFETVHKQEIANYESYVNYAKVARKEEDEHALQFLTEFIDMQVTELSEFGILMGKVKAYSAVPGLFYHLDHELRKWFMTFLN